MTKFKELSKEKVSVVEKNIAAKWDEIDILNKTIENRKDSKNFVFYDGPATANGMPGLHHMLAKLLKDAFCKYKTMKGYRVVRKAGWDTHGLPVELEVEKELGFTSKTDIEDYGIEAFNKKCKESVFRNEQAFRDYTKKMGQFIDLDNAYVTYDNNYIETEWWILNEMFKKGLIYEGHKILPFCTRCGTGLASHEVAQGYQEISSDTVIVPMKKKDENVYFLVWTTTPWTLLANVALCVNPKEKYIKVESKGYNFILAASLADKVLGSEYNIIEEYTGKDLEYVEYEQLLPFIDVDKKAFYVTCDEYVTMEDGTGIVHIAPAFGADDYEVGRRYGLPVLNPVSEDGKYNSGPWSNMYVMDANIEVIKYLKENDKLFKKEKLAHNYPHCWRCKTPLLYYAKPSWYIEVTKYKDLMISENNKVNWYPDYIGEKRFGNWLENLNDWAISRNRYWGTPLNIWRCDCGHLESIGSRAELVSRAIEKIDESIELHRPYVDNIHLECPKCSNQMSRVPEVIDVWFDSGSMPFAQYHYPFENKELFEEQFPADFISEGIDQTRGWFYVLLAISTFVTGKAPYKNVLVNDMLLDKHGQKMSKSKGNSLDPFKLIEEYGTDTLRWYLPYVSPVWTPTKFDVEGLKEIHSKFFNTLKNTYNFFTLYANTDDVDPRTFDVPYNMREEIDKWLLSKYNKLVKEVTMGYDEYDLTKVVRSITDFVNEDLSNWYIRRNRRRFWGSELDDSKKAVYKTTYEVLEGLSRLIAPIVPFVSEEIYQNLTNKESVHLSDFPKSDVNYINEEIEAKMDLIRDLISLGRAGREEAKIKVRQPISEIIIDGKHEALIGDLTELIKEELNVKNITFTPDLSLYMNFIVIPNYKVAGPMFGPKIKLFANALNNLTKEQVKDVNNQKNIVINIDDKDYEVTPDMVEIRITSKEGFNANMQNNRFIILNTALNQELLDEGIARELVSKVQQMRKSKDFDVVDRINIYYNGNDDFKRVIEKHNDFIKRETLAVDIIYKETAEEKVNLNDLDVALEVSKIGE
ncbi:MAG TPA: isoleucine--tRNA ligase [Mollicutes bacterium]|nr:isoleucine--tRNA ligase [Mollicutes bacterium]